jgi:predicted phosphodiesterase
MDEEQLTRITHWYLKKRFENNKNICICENTYGNDIITLDIEGHSIGAVHGDKDAPSDVVEKLSLMTGKSFELILIGHLHHFGADEVDSCVVIQNGSLMGTDYYAVRLRKRSIPSQNIILINKDDVANDIHRITF